MNKKFFTLLVALLATISFGAFANVEVKPGFPVATDKYEANKIYLLETNAGNYLAVNDGKLITITAAELTGPNFTYAKLQAALWKVKATPGSSSGAVTTMATYVYTNVATSIALSLDSEKAVIPASIATGDNTMGGDIDTWIASTNSVKLVKNYYYVTAEGDKVITMGATGNKVVPVVYETLGALQAAAATAAGIDLTALQAAVTNAQNAVNSAQATVDKYDAAETALAAITTAIAALDLGSPDYTNVNAASVAANTALAAISVTPNISTVNVTGAGDITTLEGEVTASEGAVSSARTAPDNTLSGAKTTLGNAKNALTNGAIGADAIITAIPRLAGGEIALSANDLNTYLGKTGTFVGGQFLADAASSFKLLITPKNTVESPFTKELQARGVTVTAGAGVLVGQGSALSLVNTTSYQDMNSPWVALYSPADKKYLVVDTAIYAGTDQMLNVRIKTTMTTELYDNNKQKGRLADSYLYKFTYDAENDGVLIQSRAFINKAADPANAINEEWNVSEAIAAASTRISMDKYFTVAKLVNETVYTFGDDAKDVLIKLDATAKYQATRVPSGVYLLKVTGSANANNIGKFVKLSLDGIEEYVPQAVRQNFQHMPSAQWVIESTTTNTAKITNREFSAPIDGGYSGKVTYKAGDKQFFFLGGDTLQYIAVTDTKDVKQGYKYVDNDNFAYLNNYVFRYLHELSMNNPVYAEKGTRQPLFVNGDNDATPSEFRLESAAIDTFGYTGNLKDVVALERSAYRVATYKAISFDKKKYYVTYDEDDKQYFLVESNKDGSAPATASVFYLKENNEVPATAEGAKADCYYTLLEANTYVGNFAIIDKTDASTLVYYHGLPYNFDYTTTMAAYTNGTFVLAGNDGKPLAFDSEEDAEAAYAEGVGETPIKIGSKYYAYVCGMCLYNAYLHGSNNFYASSKVSVDNNTLALVNGVLDDNTEAEVNNSAFMVKPDDNILYRTLGAEEDEENPLEQNIRIYRVNATAKEYLYEDANSVYSSEPKGPNTLPSDKRTSQINFLGVEGKGDNKLEEAVMTARYVRGTVMPQYLLMVNYKETPATSASCPICDELPEPIPGCPHHDATTGFSTARVLVSLQDSVLSSKRDKSIFEWNGKTRLAFVDGMFTHGEKTGVKDSLLTIVRSEKEAKFNVFPVKFTAKETPNEGKHQPVFFSFRLIEEGNKQFLMESAGEIGGKTANTWVKVQNGVPVLQTTSFSEAVNSEAELFDWEVTDDAAVANDNVELAKVSVAGDYGQVIIKGAAGKTVVISNVLGQTIATQTISEDNVTIQAPAGVVVVAVQGEKAVKALVK